MNETASLLTNVVIDLGGLGILSGILAAVSMPSGASAIIMSVNGGMVVTNVRNPKDWFDAAGNWGQIADGVSNAQSDIGGMINGYPGFGDYWQGAAATAFDSYLTKDFLPALTPLSTLANDMATACTQVGLAEVTFIVALIGADLAAITAMEAVDVAAFATFGAALAGQWAVAAAWAGAVAAIIGGLTIYFNAFQSNVNKIRQDADAVAGAFFDDARRLTGSRLSEDYKNVNVDMNWSDMEWLNEWGKKNPA